MQSRLKKFLSLFLATLLLCLSSTLFPVAWSFEPLIAQVQVTQNPATEALRLLQAGLEQLNRGQFSVALGTCQQALATYRKIGIRLGESATLNCIGKAYYQQSQNHQALQSLQEALVIDRKSGDRASEGRTLTGIALVHFNLSHYPHALESLQPALAIFRELGDRQGEGVALNSLALIYQEQGRYNQAIEYYQRSLAIRREVGNRSGEAITLDNLGLIYQQQGKYPQALELHQQALTIFRELGNRLSEGVTLGRIGEVYKSQGEYHKALEFYQQGLTIFKEVGNRTAEGGGLRAIGFVYFNLGQYQQALESMQQGLTIQQEVGNRREQGNTLQDIGIVYSQLGQYQKALELFQQVLTVYKEIGLRAGEGSNLDNTGRVYFNLGQYQKALELLQQALAIRREVDDRRGEGITLNNLGLVYFALARYQQALEVFQQGLAIDREIGDRAGEGTTLGNIGLVYYSQGQSQEALSYSMQALAISREVSDRAGEGNTLGNIGIALWQSGRLLEGTEKLFAAIEVLESLRPGLSDIDKVSIIDRQADIYVVLQKALITQNKAEAALEIAERGRARAFVDLLAQRLATSETDFKPPQLPNIKQIQQIAKEQNTTLVEYSIVNFKLSGKEQPLEPVLYIWVIQPNGEIHFQSINLTSLDQSLIDLVVASRESIGVRNRSELATIVPELKPEAQQRQQAQQRQKLQQLHQLLIEPIAQYLPTNPNERVIFIPQGELFLVPFPALVDTEGNYLIKKHTILTAPSIQVLDLTRQQRQLVGANSSSLIQGDNALVVGNPIMPKVWNLAKGIEEQLSSLPGAEEEAVTIAKVLATKPMLWEQASESAVVQRMPQARIIHLSTHGLLEYGTPQNSGVQDVPGAIALSPSVKDDGLLTSAEILKMKLKAELVVLSACDTGRGRITGDGVIGLSRSLITAGVPSVIVSLWSVPDAPTAELMSEFYRQWQQNSDKAKALRQAMLITMQNHPNPRDWAAFTLIGESE